MKTRQALAQQRGEGMLDVLAIIAAVAVIALMVLPSIAKAKAKPKRINCTNNLKQIGLAFRLWALDNGDKYPMQVSTNVGGTMELVESGAVFPHFNAMSNELSTPKIIVCSWDEGRKQVTTFATLKDTNISYFLGLDADPAVAGTWLVGDRNLATNGTPLRTGLMNMPDGAKWSWTRQLHDRKGYICRVDGIVGLTDGDGRGEATIPLQRSAADALQGYFMATSNTSLRLAIP